MARAMKTAITPLDEVIRNARAKGRKRITIGNYRVYIYNSYALFEDLNPGRWAKENL